jgi:DNA-binding transcriptional LysR family regulator
LTDRGDFLQWLRGFYYVAKRRSVTQAAMEMRRNQPTISHQIKCLESEFGVALFERSSGKMELTPEGRALLEKAQLGCA